MKDILDFLAAFNPVTVVIRVALAAIAGALVGTERERHGHPAGLRTHMMVSLGAALTTMIGLFATTELGMASDPLRVGAQVISGIGFLGAGTILLRGCGSRITGLTTAAGLWTAAAIGLAVGMGFYLGAFLTVFFVMLTFTIVTRAEAFMNRNRQRMSVYLELDSVDAVRPMLDLLRADFGLLEAQVTPPRSGTQPHVGMEVVLRVPRKVSVQENLDRVATLDRVVFALRNI